MAPNLATVLTLVPQGLWKTLKKFVKRDKIVIADTPFLICTKYTSALIVVMLCVSFANQFVRNVEIDCTTSATAGGAGRPGYAGGGSQVDNELNNYCWNYETFLVAKALLPSMRGKVTYPGVYGYSKGEDVLIRQRYYKYVWLILVQLGVIAFLPYFLWKFKGQSKMVSLVKIQQQRGVDEDEQRVAYFLDTSGFNTGFACYYLVCKLLSVVSPFAMWYYLCGFIGSHYSAYGLDVLMNFMDQGDPWPNPMDKVFPKIAKCEWVKYGFTGDMEIQAAQCQLPMNNLTQWSFFVFWWWIMMLMVINLISSVNLLLTLLPWFRRAQYVRLVEKCCREDIEMARNIIVETDGRKIKKRRKTRNVVKVNVSFGDYLVLHLLKRNLQDWQYREFVRKMVSIPNNVVRIQSELDNESHVESVDSDQSTRKGNLDSNLDIGFHSSVLGGVYPPKYQVTGQNIPTTGIIPTCPMGPSRSDTSSNNSTTSTTPNDLILANNVANAAITSHNAHHNQHSLLPSSHQAALSPLQQQLQAELSQRTKERRQRKQSNRDSQMIVHMPPD